MKHILRLVNSHNKTITSYATNILPWLSVCTRDLHQKKLLQFFQFYPR